MIKIAEFRAGVTGDRDPSPLPAHKLTIHKRARQQQPSAWLRQMLRFALVGGLNTCIDLLILNCLLWLSPTTNTSVLLAYNMLAFSLGALNSFLLNKYWTFGQRQRTTRRELARFSLVTLAGIAWSSCVIWLASTALRTNAWFALHENALLWANASKVIAIASSALLSYLIMRLWVFVRSPRNTHRRGKIDRPVGKIDQSVANYEFAPQPSSLLLCQTTFEPLGRSRFIVLTRHLWRSQRVTMNLDLDRALPSQMSTNEHERASSGYWTYENERYRSHSLSVVLPVYNEEGAIASTIERALSILPSMVSDFEIIAVDDGSTDRSGPILAAIAQQVPQLRMVTHTRNQGYGAALADGFAAASKELTFFMDSDGQFDIEDLYGLLTHIGHYDAVIGYRLLRQDTIMRKLNAWGWHTLIGLVLHVHVRDIDCAFKLFRTNFLHQYAPETRGAMINAEMLYKLARAGYTYQEVGVNHLPRQAGKATGAHPRVIARAFRELFFYARKWRHSDNFFPSTQHAQLVSTADKTQ